MLFLAHLFTGSDTFSELQCYAGVCFQLSTFHGLRNWSSVPHAWALSIQSSELQRNRLQCLVNLWILHSYLSSPSSLLPAFSLFPFLPLRTLLIFLPNLLYLHLKEKKICTSSLSINFKFYILGLGVSARSLVYNIFVLPFRVKFSLNILRKWHVYFTKKCFSTVGNAIECIVSQCVIRICFLK